MKCPLLFLCLLAIIGTTELTTGTLAQPKPQVASSIDTRPTLPVKQSSQDLRPQIILRVYNYAHVDAGFLFGAEEIATGILKEAKVAAKWVHCPLPQEEDDRYPECLADLGTNAFTLNILTPEMAIKIPTHDETLGYALTPCDEIATSCTIYVMFFRVSELAQRFKIMPARLLGHVLVHEIGHMLLGVDHSPKGIMRGGWGRNEMKIIEIGILDFSTEQAAQLRATLLRRAVQQRVAQNVNLSTSR
jgi:hypothetical protein